MANPSLVRAAKEEKARRILQQRQAPQETSIGSVVGDVAQSVARGFNKGLAGVGGFVDLFNLPFGFEKPVGGSEWIEGKMESADMVGGEKYPFVANVAEVPGMAATFFGAGGAAARTAATGGKYLAPILESFRTAPKYNAMMELYTAGRAGVGSAVAQELFPENHTAEFVGTMAGGLLSPAAVLAPLARKSMGGIRAGISHIAPGGAERAAAKQVQKVVSQDPKQAAKSLRMAQEGDLTPAQELSDPGLLRLQKAFESADPLVAQAVKQKGAKVKAKQQTDYSELAGGDRGGAADFLEQRVKYVTEQAENLSTKAMLNAKAALEKLPQGVSREAESIAVREAINKSYKQARASENALWNEVDGSTVVQTKAIFDKYDEVVASLAKAERGDVPEIVSKHLHPKAQKSLKYKENESLTEIKVFRTKLLEASRREASETVPNRKVLGILDDMQGVSLEVMENSGAAGPLQEAKVFSRQLNDRFTRGIIGKIRSTARRGGPSVADEETLLHIIKEGPPGAVRYDKLMDATGGNKEAVSAVESYLGRLFVKQAVDVNGNVVPSSAQRFIKSNSEVLDRLPGLKKKLVSAKEAKRFSDRTSKRMSSRVKSIWDKRRSRAALYLGGSPKNRIQKVLTSDKPAENMAQLGRMVQKDPTGVALRGLQGELLDDMWRAGTNSGKQMGDYLRANSKIFAQIFKPDEMQRIAFLVNRANKLEATVAGGRSMKQILDETPDVMIDLLSRIVGANIGGMSAIGKSTGAPIVVAHAGSKFVRGLTNKIPMSRTRDVLADAVLDKTKMIQLLERVRTPKQADVFTRRMNSWLVSIIPEMRESKDSGGN